MNSSPATLLFHDLGQVALTLRTSSLSDHTSWEDSGSGGHIFHVMWSHGGQTVPALNSGLQIDHAPAGSRGTQLGLLELILHIWVSHQGFYLEEKEDFSFLVCFL